MEHIHETVKARLLAVSFRDTVVAKMRTGNGTLWPKKRATLRATLAGWTAKTPIFIGVARSVQILSPRLSISPHDGTPCDAMLPAPATEDCNVAVHSEPPASAGRMVRDQVRYDDMATAAGLACASPGGPGVATPASGDCASRA